MGRLLRNGKVSKWEISRWLVLFLFSPTPRHEFNFQTMITKATPPPTLLPAACIMHSFMNHWSKDDVILTASLVAQTVPDTSSRYIIGDWPSGSANPFRKPNG